MTWKQFIGMTWATAIISTTSCTTTGSFLPPDDSGTIEDTNPTDDTSTDPMDEPTTDPLDDTSVSELPNNEYCNSLGDWPDASTSFEQQVLALVNDRRSEGADCGSEGSFEPAGELTMNAALTCAARNHAKDMNVRDFFDHTNPDGDTMTERIDAAGYEPSAWGENIALGQSTPDAVMSSWMTSPGHCANIMNPSFTELGVGYYEGNYWVQVFAKPR